jgi:hypothetical protein
VVIAHGDQHTYTVTSTYGGQSNVTRLENFGSSGAVQKWVQVKATCGTDHVFSQRARSVGVAPVAYTDFPPNVPPVPASQGPFLGMIVVSGLIAGSWALTRRRRRQPALG